METEETDQDGDQGRAGTTSFGPITDNHIKSGFSIVESQPILSKTALRLRNQNVTNSYLGINGQTDVTSSFVSLSSAKILQSAHAGQHITLRYIGHCPTVFSIVIQ